MGVFGVIDYVGYGGVFVGGKIVLVMVVFLGE